MLNAWTMPGLPGRRRGDPATSPLRALDEAGFTSVVATNSEHEFRLGTGRSAPASSAAKPVSARELPSRPPRREATLRAAEVRAGDVLAPCPVPITTTLIVAGAIA